MSMHGEPADRILWHEQYEEGHEQPMLNIPILTADDRVFELPLGFSERLHARLEQEIQGESIANGLSGGFVKRQVTALARQRGDTDRRHACRTRTRGQAHSLPRLADGSPMMVIEVLTAPEPPLHLLLGSDAFDYVQKELEALHIEFAQWESLTRSTNFE